MKKSGVIGAGTMGNGIAHAFAQSGYNVCLIDVSQNALDKALLTIEKNLDRQLSKERITEAEKSQTLYNIQCFTEMTSAVKGLDLVVEAATENIDIKLKIFQQLDECCDDHTILVTK